MKPAQFDYAAPRTVDEAVHLLSREGAKLLAGGQSLVPVLNMRLARPSLLVDINQLTELDYVRRDGNYVAIGALTRHQVLTSSPLVKETLPLLATVTRSIGHAAIRNRGTIGGSLAHADPSAELPVAMVTLDAELVVTGPTGKRTIAAQDFFVGYLTTALAPNEILTEIRVPIPPEGTAHAFEELARRNGDFAIVAVLATVLMDANGRCAQVRLGVGGANPTPLRVRAAENALTGQVPGAVAIEAAATAVALAVDPDSDLHASAEYRRELAQVLTRRALRIAVERAKGGAV